MTVETSPESNGYALTAWSSVAIGAEILIVSKNGPTQIEAIVIDKTKTAYKLYFPLLYINMRFDLSDQEDWYPHIKS